MSDSELGQKVAGRLRRLGLTQYVVTSGDQLHRRGEVPLPTRRGVGNRRGDDTEDDAAHDARDQRSEENRRWTIPSTRPKKTPSHAPETMPPPITLAHVKPTENSLDLHQVNADDRDVLNREFLIGEVIDCALRLGVGGVRPDGPSRRRCRQRSTARPIRRLTERIGHGWLRSSFSGTSIHADDASTSTPYCALYRPDSFGYASVRRVRAA